MGPRVEKKKITCPSMQFLVCRVHQLMYIYTYISVLFPMLVSLTEPGAGKALQTFAKDIGEGVATRVTLWKKYQQISMCIPCTCDHPQHVAQIQVKSDLYMHTGVVSLHLHGAYIFLWATRSTHNDIYRIRYSFHDAVFNSYSLQINLTTISLASSDA